MYIKIGVRGFMAWRNRSWKQSEWISVDMGNYWWITAWKIKWRTQLQWPWSWVMGDFDPLAYYRCGVRSHLARDCPSKPGQNQLDIEVVEVIGSSTCGSSFQIRAIRPTNEDEAEVVRCDSGPLMCCMMRTGIGYPVDDAGQLYIPLEFTQNAGDAGAEEGKDKNTKN